MISIREPPSKLSCASCMDPLIWLYSSRTSAWVAFVADRVYPTTLHMHRCQHAQDPPTWRTLTFRSPGAQVDINRRGKARALGTLAAVKERAEDEVAAVCQDRTETKTAPKGQT